MSLLADFMPLFCLFALEFQLLILIILSRDITFLFPKKNKLDLRFVILGFLILSFSFTIFNMVASAIFASLPCYNNPRGLRKPVLNYI